MDAAARYPCPCCGHLTLSEPGAYDYCPVCFWEDDGESLRYPARDVEGPNHMSLQEGQANYLRFGAMHRDFRRKVRRPRPDEPLDEGWRPFDRERDWTDPRLDSDVWPANHEALYYWRPTYWNGDQHTLPLPEREPDEDDRHLAHLRATSPELDRAAVEQERRWGRASAWRTCRDASRLVVEAYERGDDASGLRIVTSLLPALDPDSGMHVPMCVDIAFLEDLHGHDGLLEEHVRSWPAPIREAFRDQQAAVLESKTELESEAAAWTALWRDGRGRPVADLVEELRELRSQPGLDDHPTAVLGREVTARILSSRRWLLRHPIDSAALAWRFRATQRRWRTLRWLARPRFAG